MGRLHAPADTPNLIRVAGWWGPDLGPYVFALLRSALQDDPAELELGGVREAEWGILARRLLEAGEASPDHVRQVAAAGALAAGLLLFGGDSDLRALRLVARLLGAARERRDLEPTLAASAAARVLPWVAPPGSRVLRGYDEQGEVWVDVRECLDRPELLAELVHAEVLDVLPAELLDLPWSLEHVICDMGAFVDSYRLGSAPPPPTAGSSRGKKDPRAKEGQLVNALLAERYLLGASDTKVAVASGLSRGAVGHTFKRLLKRPNPDDPGRRIAVAHFEAKRAKVQQKSGDRRSRPRSRDGADLEELGKFDR